MTSSSRKHLCLLPDSLGSANNIEWIPANKAANVVWEIASSISDGIQYREYNRCDASRGLGHEQLGTGVVYLNVVNPHRTMWQELLPNIQAQLSRAYSDPFPSTLSSVIPIGPFEEWIDKLRTNEKTLTNAHDHFSASTVKKSGEPPPTLPLLDFYASLLPTIHLKNDENDDGDLRAKPEESPHMYPILDTRVSQIKSAT